MNTSQTAPGQQSAIEWPDRTQQAENTYPMKDWGIAGWLLAAFVLVASLIVLSGGLVVIKFLWGYILA